MSEFKEYPKRMSHPQHAPAVWRKLEGKGVGLFAPDTIMEKPERFPEVTVATREQEQQYAARGYRPNNMPDPVAYEQALLDMKPVPGYQNNAYPKWKYSKLDIPVIVKNEVEEKALAGEWFDHPVIATEDDLMEEQDDEEEEEPVVVAAPAKTSKPKTKAKGTGRGKYQRTPKSAHA